jgi:hypothetical protein
MVAIHIWILMFWVADTKWRSITWGILIQYFIQFGCSYINGVASFRVPWGLQMIPAIVLSLGMLLFPESPRYLIDHDRYVTSYPTSSVLSKSIESMKHCRFSQTYMVEVTKRTNWLSSNTRKSDNKFASLLYLNPAFWPACFLGVFRAYRGRKILFRLAEARQSTSCPLGLQSSNVVSVDWDECYDVRCVPRQPHNFWHQVLLGTTSFMSSRAQV